jgi:filamentous hemagglutinin
MAGFLTSKRPLPVINPAQLATEFIVNSIFLSAAARHISAPGAANSRSSLVVSHNAMSHALTRTATACCVRSPSHAHVHATHLQNSIHSPIHYQTNSTPRTFYNCYRPISLINSSSSSISDASSTSNFKPFEPLPVIKPALSATEFIVSNITLVAQSIDILPSTETSAQQTETKTRQSGLTVSLSSPLISAAETVINTAKAVLETKDGRAQALGVASAGLYLYNNAKSIGDAGKALSEGNILGKDGVAGAASISISLGSSRSQSNSSSTSTTSVGSTLAAGGNITLNATSTAGASKDAGKNSNLTIQGSTIRADGNVSLLADNQVNLLAGENTANSKSTSKSSSASIGASLGGQTGVTLSGSRSRGSSDGSDVTYTNTEVTAGNNLTITSGGSTTLSGANVAGKTVNVDVGKQFGGNLTIESLQDTSVFTEKSKTSGGSITIGPGGIPTGGSISSGKTNINSNFQSVGKQSGIAAGDGGFTVNVQGNTTLAGGVITSTQAAVDAGLNSFTTGTKNADGSMLAGTGNLTITDISNTASYTANSSSFTAGFSVGKDAKTGDSKTTPSGSAGIGSDSGNANSITVGGITGIAGEKNVLTGVDTTNALRPIFNADTVRADINAQVFITAQFGAQASTAWGTYSNKQLQDAIESKDKQAIECWSAGGSCRVAGHVAIGGATGGTSGALGAGTAAIGAPIIANAISDAGITGISADVLTTILTTSAGAAVGGAAGAAGALNEVQNNYLTSEQWNDFSKEYNDCQASRGSVQACRDGVIATYQAISKTQDAILNAACKANSPECGILLSDALAGSKAGENLVISGTLTPNFLGGANFNNNIPAFVQTYITNQVNDYCKANPQQCNDIKPILAFYGITGAAVSGAAVAINFTRIAAWSGLTVQGCISNLPLCVNQASLVGADIIAGEALGGATIVGGAAAVGTGAKVVANIGGAASDTAVGLRAGHGQGIFTYIDIAPYTPSRPTLGQLTGDSCVAASCRMASGMNEPEAYIRGVLQTDSTGTLLSNVPAGLRTLGFSGEANYVSNITANTIASATSNGSVVIVNLRVTGSSTAHAVVVDSISNGRVYIRDPWPIGTGSSYSVPVSALNSTTLTGSAVIIRP